MIQKFQCARCGREIPDENIRHYGTQPVTITESFMFQIKHSFSGGEKDVHRWRSTVFCDKCAAKLEKVYRRFMGEKKKESKNA